MLELISTRIDRSVASRQVDKVENTYFKSTTIHRLISVPSSSSMAFNNIYPSFMASTAARVLAEVMDFTGHFNLWELQESVPADSRVVLWHWQCFKVRRRSAWKVPTDSILGVKTSISENKHDSESNDRSLCCYSTERQWGKNTFLTKFQKVVSDWKMREMAQSWVSHIL